MINLAKIFGLEPKTPKITKRLENLCKYATMFSFNEDRLKTLEKSWDKTDKCIIFQFNSGLGLVQIELGNYMLCERVYYLEYSNYAGSTVFKIHANHSVQVEPMLGEDLTAQDIDLAILELEDYLSWRFGPVDDCWEKYLKSIEETKALHISEIQKLM